jgi:cytochrome oxidase Cu insertion factor (SCO1/SenC/PrrC family)
MTLSLRGTAAYLITLAILGVVAVWIGESGALAESAGVPVTANNKSTSNTARKEVSLRLLDIDGKPFDLRQASKGPVRVVVFTRSDCPISNRYAPEVRSLCEKFQNKGVDFYLVYVDPEEKPESIRQHIRDFKYPCTGIRDPEHTLVAKTGATVTPEAVVFNRDWKLVYRGRVNDLYVDLGTARPAATKHDLEDAIVATLAGVPVAEPVTKAVGCYIGDLKAK